MRTPPFSVKPAVMTKELCKVTRLGSCPRRQCIIIPGVSGRRRRAILHAMERGVSGIRPPPPKQHVMWRIQASSVAEERSPPISPSTQTCCTITTGTEAVAHGGRFIDFREVKLLAVRTLLNLAFYRP